MNTIKKSIITKSAALLAVFALVLSSAGVNRASAAPNWDVSGTFVMQMNYNEVDYPHNLTLAQDEAGMLTGGGSSGAYMWDVTSGSVDGDIFQIDAEYSATEDAAGTILTLDGTIAEDGSISGVWADNYQGGERVGTFSTEAGVAEEIVSEANVTTDPATAITISSATLNGTNGAEVATDSGFWWGPSAQGPFTAEVDPSGQFPAGWSSQSTGAQLAEASFSHALSSLAADTEYHFVAWSQVGGTWYPGEVLSFTTSADEVPPETVKVTIIKYVDGEMATAENANNTDFLMNASWDAENIGAGSGQFSLSETGFNNPTAYHATTTDMTSGADYAVSEVSDSDIVGASCESEQPYALTGYRSGDTLEEAEAAATSLTSPSFTDLTSDKYVLVLNDDCATEDVDGEIGGEVIGGEGELEVTSVEVLDGTATADNTYENGWKYRFNITVPTDENGVAMKFANWDIDGPATDSIPAANNMRISSAQADNGGATITVLAADTYTTPDLNITSDLNPLVDGLQIQVLVEVKIPAGTTNGSYTTSYGVRSQ